MSQSHPDTETVLPALPVTALVDSLPASTPFVGPEALERQRGRPFRARIGANESAFGISPNARDAMTRALDRVAWYGDPENHELRALLAEQLGVQAENICVDAGIDSLLGLTVRMLVSPGSPVVTSAGAYPTLNYHIAGFGGELVTVPYLNDHEDPDALLSAARHHDAPLMYLCNPDNPMGTWHSADTVSRLMAQVPARTILALDEAYIEFAPADAVVPLDTDNPRVIRYRTFSKAWGMAGMRIGYVIAHRALITCMNKIRNHFAVGRLAQAGAIASLQDPSFLATVQREVATGRQRIADLATRHGLTSIPSATNFVAIDMGSTERATRMMHALHERDVFVRMPGVAPLNRCVRIGVGTADEHAVLTNAFADALNAVQSA